MGTLIFWLGVIAFGAAFPKTANVLARVITFGFILPFMTVAMGSVSWAVATLMGFDVSWGTCALVCGLPFAGLLVAFIMSGEDL